MGKLIWSFSSLLQWRKRKVKAGPFFIFLVFQYFPFPPGRLLRQAPSNFPPKNKGFINYVFCRNWAVRTPARTRLDSSSLVNKQFDVASAGQGPCGEGSLCSTASVASSPTSSSSPGGSRQVRPLSSAWWGVCALVGWSSTKYYWMIESMQ